MNAKGRLTALVAAVICVFLADPALAADPYAIDPAHSEIQFSIRNFVVGRVHGRFTEFSGTILYDKGEISRSSVTADIQAASVDTGNRQRDGHLRSPAFFDAAAYPSITFRSARVEPLDGGYVCTGTLTLHGVSREIRVPFRVSQRERSRDTDRIGIEANLTLNRRDYGISWNVLIGNEVRVRLRLEAVHRGR